MKQEISLRPTPAGRALVLLAALGFTALVGLAALEPAAEPGRRAAPSDVSHVRERDPALRTVEPAFLTAGDIERDPSPHFERSNEPAIERDPLNAHGG